MEAPFFARWSATSLPVTPQCPGIHCKTICLECSDRLCSSFLQSRMLEEAEEELEFTAKIAAFESQKTTALICIQSGSGYMVSIVSRASDLKIEVFYSFLKTAWLISVQIRKLLTIVGTRDETPEALGRNPNQAVPLVPVHPAQNHVGSTNASLGPSGVCSKERGRRRFGIGGEREDDIEELIMGHEDELTTEELQEILNEEHQETQRNVSPEQEEDEEVQCRHLPLKIFRKSGRLSEQWS
ncbi:hypothetical protein TNCV_2245381 [Trichonephila clavipes]|nr:hypothetical protein TNCV_2245381 [Trichonephila clavipes]